MVERRDFESVERGRIDGSRMCEYEYSPRTKFESECLMDGGRDGDNFSNKLGEEQY